MPGKHITSGGSSSHIRGRGGLKPGCFPALASQNLSNLENQFAGQEWFFEEVRIGEQNGGIFDYVLGIAGNEQEFQRSRRRIPLAGCQRFGTQLAPLADKLRPLRITAYSTMACIDLFLGRLLVGSAVSSFKMGTLGMV